MNRKRMVWLAAAAVLAAGCGAPVYPPPELLGVRMGMPKAEVERLLDAEHTLTKDDFGPLGAKQNWELSHESFSWLALKYSPEHRVVYATAQVKPGGKRIRFRDLGKLENAELVGKYIYRWEVAATDGAPAYAWIARGSDPEELFSLSIYDPVGAAGGHAHEHEHEDDDLHEGQDDTE